MGSVFRLQGKGRRAERNIRHVVGQLPEGLHG